MYVNCCYCLAEDKKCVCNYLNIVLVCLLMSGNGVVSTGIYIFFYISHQSTFILSEPCCHESLQELVSHQMPSNENHSVVKPKTNGKLPASSFPHLQKGFPNHT